MKLENNVKKGLWILIVSSFLMLSWIFLWGGMDVARADELITCRYLSSRGQKIVLELDVGSPAPAMIILIQKVPASTAIINSAPQYKKYDAQRGEAKWLFTGIKPGRTKMAMTLSKPIKSSELRGEIRYKNPETGRMVTMPIMP